MTSNDYQRFDTSVGFWHNFDTDTLPCRYTCTSVQFEIAVYDPLQVWDESTREKPDMAP